MRVVTWNVWGVPIEGHRARHAALARQLQAEDPDVAFLQEVCTREALGRLESLPGYQAFYHPTSILKTPQGGLVTLVRRSLIQGVPAYRFHPYGRPLLPTAWSLAGLVNLVGEIVGNKGIGHVELTLQGHRCHLINTHLDCPDIEVNTSRLDDVNNRRTLWQAGLLSNYIATLRPPLILLGGDFNVPAQTPGYGTLLRRLNASTNGAPLRDLSAGIGSVDIPQYDAPIDYVIGNLFEHVHQRRYIAPGSAIPGRMSDHPGVLVEGTLSSSSAADKVREPPQR